jgi:hypothetical protein
MHLTHVLCKLSVVEYSYQSNKLDNLLIGTFRSNYINFHEIICSYETINFENLKQLV